MEFITNHKVAIFVKADKMTSFKKREIVMKNISQAIFIVIFILLCSAISGCCKGNHWFGGIFATTETVKYCIKNEQEKKEQKQELEKIRQEANTITVNVTNQNGSITPVALKKEGNVYVGPKGEQYLAVPTHEQLQQVYGF